MTHDIIEASTDDGSPVELYRFTIGTSAWFYTTADSPILFQGNVYEPTRVAHTKISDTREKGRKDITVRLPRTAELAALYLVSAPNAICNLSVYRQHISDSSNDFILDWSGRVIQPVNYTGFTAFVGQSIESLLNRNGLRRTFSFTCPHTLYDPLTCRASPAAHSVPGVVSSLSGVTITVAAAAGESDGWFDGGKLEWFDTTFNIVEARSILTHVGDTLVVEYNPYRLTVGLSVQLFPGCDRTVATCDTKFSNKPNHGGCPYGPVKTPFETSVY